MQDIWQGIIGSYDSDNTGEQDFKRGNEIWQKPQKSAGERSEGIEAMIEFQQAFVSGSLPQGTAQGGRQAIEDSVRKNW